MTVSRKAELSHECHSRQSSTMCFISSVEKDTINKYRSKVCRQLVMFAAHRPCVVLKWFSVHWCIMLPHRQHVSSCWLNSRCVVQWQTTVITRLVNYYTDTFNIKNLSYTEHNLTRTLVARSRAFSKSLGYYSQITTTDFWLVSLATLF